MSEVNNTETPQQKLDRYWPAVQQYLNELKTANPNYAAVAYARTKFPFLDWVLSGKPPIEYFTPDPPDPPVVTIPWEIESPGFPKPEIPDNNSIFQILKKIAAKLGVA